MRSKRFTVILSIMTVLLVAGGVSMVAAASRTQQYMITNEYMSTASNASIAVTANNDAWAVTQYSNTAITPVILKVSSNGATSTVTTPAQLRFIAKGPDNQIWGLTSGTSNTGAQLVLVGDNGQFQKTITIPAKSDWAYTYLPIGYYLKSFGDKLWFIDINGNQVVSATTDGVVNKYNPSYYEYAPGKGGVLRVKDVVVDKNGTPWYAASLTVGTIRYAFLASINLSTGVSTLLPIDDQAYGAITVADGEVWSIGKSKLAHLLPSGDISYTPIPASMYDRASLVYGKDGAFWFSQDYGTKIGRYSPSTGYSSVDLGTTTQMDTLIFDNSSNLWFNINGKFIGKYDTPYPNYVDDLHALRAITNTPSLAWTSALDATSYSVYRNGTLLQSLSDNNFVDSTALEGQNSYYLIANNGDGSSGPSNVVNVQVDKTGPDINYVLSSQPNSNGWYNHSVTVSFSCSDTGSGIDTCSPSVTINSSGQQKVTGTAVDKAGNFKSVSVDIKVDLTPPQISFIASSTGWVKPGSQVEYQCINDGVTQTYTAPVVTDENGNSSATGTCTDNAGNETSQTVPIKVDPSDPVITPVFTSSRLNTMGWSTVPVTVTFVCSDPLADPNDPDSASGIESCSEPVTVSDEGMHLISGIARDRAGNYTEVIVSVGIDYTKPTMTYKVSAEPNSSGWYNQDVTVTFDCHDALSGIVACPLPVTVSGDGSHEIVRSVEDNAGNSTEVTIPILIDKQAPLITASISPEPNMSGWNNKPATVSFSCQDTPNDTESGIDYCSPPVTVTTEGATVVTGTAIDKAGNTQEMNVVVSVDTVEPEISYTITPSEGQWSRESVHIAYTCSDATSGIVSCPTDETITDESNTVIYRKATDAAGNQQTVAIPIKIDKTVPTITYHLLPVANSFDWNSSAVVVAFDCSDGTDVNASGIYSCTSPVTVDTEGSTIVEGIATDNAGNSNVIEVVVNIDLTDPSIVLFTPTSPNAYGWFQSDVVVSSTCNDVVSGINNCVISKSSAITQDGIYMITGYATDYANRRSDANLSVKLDKTAPLLALPTWSLNPKPTTSSATLSVLTTENLSGIRKAEYFVGATDPGKGNATPMTLTNQYVYNGAVTSAAATADFGTGMTPGVYKISYRVQDNAGNWSLLGSDYLVVYNSTGPKDVTVKDNNIAPVLGVDVLPGLVIANQKDKATIAYDVSYNTVGAVDTSSKLVLTYSSDKPCNGKQTCVVMDFSAGAGTSGSSITHLVISDDGTMATYDGVGKMVMNDGSTAYYPFKVITTDSSAQKSSEIYIYGDEQNMEANIPLYQLHVNPAKPKIK